MSSETFQSGMTESFNTGPSFRGNKRPKSVNDAGSKGSSTDWSLPPALLNSINEPSADFIDQILPVSVGDPLSSITFGSKIDASPSVDGDFMKALHATPDTKTQKGSAAFSSTHNPCLDLYVDMAQGISPTTLFSHLDKSWACDPVATLRIIYQARSIHKGKGDKFIAFRALGWLWDKSPRTLIENLYMLVEPTCARPHSKKKDEFEAKKRGKQAEHVTKTAEEVDDFEVIEAESEDHALRPEYPPRPHGSFKDLLIILQLALDNQFSSEYTGDLVALHDPDGKKHGATMRERRNKLGTKLAQDNQSSEAQSRDLDRDGRPRKPNVKPGMSLQRGPQGVVKSGADDWECKLQSAVTKHEKHEAYRQRVISRLETDLKFRALYITIIRIFKTRLQADLAALRAFDNLPAITPKSTPEDIRRKQEPLFAISYAAKYSPSPARAFDKQLLAATVLAHALFPEVEGTVEAREHLQRWVLMPLRRALEVPETKMEDWKGINFQRVPSVAMSKLKYHFATKDSQRYVEKYLEQVKEGSKTISGAAMMPHLLLMDAMCAKQNIPVHMQGAALDSLVEVSQQVASAQWRTMIDAIESSSSVKLANSIAVVDVSGSMGGLYAYHSSRDTNIDVQPIWPAIALGIVTATISASPWKGTFITFSAEPEIVKIDTDKSLSEIANSMQSSSWGMTTNFAKVFDMLLKTAQQHNLTDEQMIKRVFVFTDMQFDSAAAGRYNETTHEAIRRNFNEAGYTLPELAYWNLQRSKPSNDYYDHQPLSPAKPVLGDTEGVTMISGFSAATMKVFLGMGEEEANAGVEEVTMETDAVVLDSSGEEVATEEKPQTAKPKTSPNEMLLRIINDPVFTPLKVYI